MPEHWEETIYPIIKDILETHTDEEDVPDSVVNILANLICQEIDKKYTIEKKR